MVKGILMIMLILPALNNFAQSGPFIPQYSTILKSDKGKKIMAQCSRSIPEGVTDYFDLSPAEVAKLDSSFRKILTVRSEGCCIVRSTVKNLDQYAFQYIGVMIGKEKYIYINAFYVGTGNKPDSAFKDWILDPVIACDGGEHYWGVLFKIKDATFSGLAINGIA